MMYSASFSFSRVHTRKFISPVAGLTRGIQSSNTSSDIHASNTSNLDPNFPYNPLRFNLVHCFFSGSFDSIYSQRLTNSSNGHSDASQYSPSTISISIPSDLAYSISIDVIVVVNLPCGHL